MNEKFRPHFHFTPPHGWMNDPNGLVFYEGEWHLFYQYLDPKNWGHAVSRDLAQWEYLPVAIEPDELGAIWSGSALVDWNDSSGFFDGGTGLVALFTYEKHGTQSQGIAYSRDQGRTWTKYENNPVLTSENPNFRDPKVFWHESTQRWVMILATGECVSFYTSTNLKDWDFVSTFGEGLVKDVWECPDLFPLPLDGDEKHIKWVLQASWLHGSIFSEGQGEDGMLYFVGDFDGTHFRSDHFSDVVLKSSHGPDDYAAVSWADAPDGRRVWIGWMSHWVYAGKVPMQPFLGVMTLPREVELKTTESGVRLFQRPVEELKALRGEAQSWSNQQISGESSLLSDIQAETFEMIVECEVSSATEFGICVRQKESQSTIIGYDAETHSVFVDRTNSGVTDFSPHFPRRVLMPLENRAQQLKLHIFVDACSVEVFINDGEAYSASLIFPDADARGLSLYSAGGTMQLKQLDLYLLKVFHTAP